MEMVDILIPPRFQKSGVTKERSQALADGDWVGTFNLWIIKSNPVQAIVYQQRGSITSYEPKKLDVSVGGHYSAGETLFDGLREAKEELGKEYDEKQVQYLGKRLHVIKDNKNILRHYVVDICFVTDNSQLNSFTLEQREVVAVFDCPIDKLIDMHENDTHFIAQGLDLFGSQIEIEVSRDMLPYNWDNYHYKVALLAKKYLAGEQNLIY